LLICNCPATTQTTSLSLHDALPILSALPCYFCGAQFPTPCIWTTSTAYATLEPEENDTGWDGGCGNIPRGNARQGAVGVPTNVRDRKSTRLNSSHVKISYAVFCLKK